MVWPSDWHAAAAGPCPGGAPTGQHQAGPCRMPTPGDVGKALIQVAVAEDAHVELSIIAKRRRLTLSAVVKAALNEWLERHGHVLRME